MSTNFLSLRSVQNYAVGGSTIADGSLAVQQSNTGIWTTSLANPFTVSSLTGSTITTTANKTLVGRSAAVPTRYIEMGSDQANSVYFDFHSSDSVEPDYSTRIQSLAGTTVGGGALALYGSTIGINTSTMTSGFQLSTSMTADLGGALKTQWNTNMVMTITGSNNGASLSGPSGGVYTLTIYAGVAGSWGNILTIGGYVYTTGSPYMISIQVAGGTANSSFSITNGSSTTYMSGTLTGSYTTYTATVSDFTGVLSIAFYGTTNQTMLFKNLSIQRMDAIPPSLGYGAMTFGGQDLGVTAATLAVSQYQGTLTGPTAGVYTFTINNTFGSTGSATAFNYIPNGTMITVSFTAKSTSNPSSWGIQSSNGVWWYGPTLTTTMTTYSFTLPTNSIYTTLYIVLFGTSGNNISWDSFNVKYALGGNTIVNGNVGIGTTAPTTANFQLAQGLTADLGKGLGTQWSDTGTTAATVVALNQKTGGTFSGPTNGIYTFISNTTGTCYFNLVNYNLSYGATYRVLVTCSSSNSATFNISDNSSVAAISATTLTSSLQVYTSAPFTITSNLLIIGLISPAVGSTFNFSAITIQRLDTVATGNVGIGTAAPRAALHEYGSSSGKVPLLIQNVNGALNSRAALHFGVWSGADTNVNGTDSTGPSAEIAAILRDTNNVNTDLAFSVYTGSAISPATATLLEAMRITAAGNVGIGTTAPSQRFEVRNTGAAMDPGFVYTQSYFYTGYTTDSPVVAYKLGWYNDDWSLRASRGAGTDIASYSISRNGTTWFNITAAGVVNLPYYTTNGTVTTVNSNGQLSVSSDRRIKNSIVYQTDTTAALAHVNHLKPAVYKMNGSEDLHLGFIAQDIEEHIPLAVDGKKYEWKWEVNEDGSPKMDADGNIVYQLDGNGEKIIRPRGVSDRALIATQTLAIQELTSRATSSATQIQELTSQLSTLRATTEAQQSTIAGILAQLPAAAPAPSI